MQNDERPFCILGQGSNARIETSMKSLAWLAVAAVAEIAGCYCFWLVQRTQKSHWLMLPGVISLILFASILARVEAPFAGRAYAAYGGIYIAMSLVWGILVEKNVPDRSDIVGVLLALSGSIMILGGFLQRR